MGKASEKAKRYSKQHIDGCECWLHGGIEEVWPDSDGILCIKYEDGSWFHYREMPEGLEWW